MENNFNFMIKHIKYDENPYDGQMKLEISVDIQEWCIFYFDSEKLVLEITELIFKTLPTQRNNENSKKKIFTICILYLWFFYFHDYLNQAYL